MHLQRMYELASSGTAIEPEKHVARSYYERCPKDPFILFCFASYYVSVRVWKQTRHDSGKWPMDWCLVGTVCAVWSSWDEALGSRFVSGSRRITIMNCSLKKGMGLGVGITIAYQERACSYRLLSTNSRLPFVQDLVTIASSRPMQLWWRF
jgi:hypothetical protein